ncbi:MAG: glycosyltransferase [Betaproteobacteria bacterium]|nr:glycosyltransferase [Betaproteobacteria bacterium]
MATGKRIVLAAFGSLGDLHPYIAVARELKRRGHRPLIATFDDYRAAVEAGGVEFTAMRPSMSGFGDFSSVMERLVDPWRGPERLVGMFMSHMRESYEDLSHAAAGADLLVTHPIAFAGPALAQKQGLRWASTVLSPLSLFSAIDPPLFPAAGWLRHVRKLGVAPYRMVLRIPRFVMRRWERPLYRLRAELGLPTPGPIAQMEGQYSPRLNLALFSRLLAAPQPDWPANTMVCGFPRYDGPPPDECMQRELDRFLAPGEPPIVFALGSSAVMVAGDFWRHAIETARRLSRRAILITGRPPEESGALPPSIKAFQYLPYSAVFPRASAIVHPGGIGTLAQALAAGRPQLVVPVAFDQPDNAQRAVRLGVARSVPFRKAAAGTMASELEKLLAAPRYAARAAATGERIGAEDAAGAACGALERLLG